VLLLNMIFQCSVAVLIPPYAPFCLDTQLHSVDQLLALSMTGPSKCMCLIVYLACVQDDVEEQYADVDSEEELEDTIIC
jgi:hypothetical protein